MYKCECVCECVMCICMSEYACVDASLYVNCRNLLNFFCQKFVCFDEEFCLLPKISNIETVFVKNYEGF